MSVRVKSHIIMCNFATCLQLLVQKHASTIKCHQHVASHYADDGATGEDLYALFLRFRRHQHKLRFTCEEKPRNDVTYIHLLPLPYHLLQLTGFPSDPSSPGKGLG